MKQNSNPYIKRVKDQVKITPTGQKYLNEVVTDTKGSVYAFSGKASPLMAAASMARLSRRGSDLREIFLDEFSGGDKDATGLIQRVVTAFGDDSVQQLVGLHLVVEDASNLLTKLLEWGRFAAYLEQSTRYIYYDQKDIQGNFKYYVPTNFDGQTTARYREVNDQIFSIYSKMVRSLTEYVRQKNPQPKDEKERMAWIGATRAQACDAIRPVLPTSTKSTVGIFGSAQAIDNLIMHLLSENLNEARIAGKNILDQARKVIPAFLERTDKPDRGGAAVAYRANTRSQMEKLVNKYLQPNSADFSDEVKLVDYWPKDELDLVPHLLFNESDLSTGEITKSVKKLSRQQKEQILKTYMGKRLNRRHRPARALEIGHYLWEITADYGTFRDLQRHRVVDAFEWQKLGISYGYNVPPLVTEAGLEKDFRRCFSLSEDLYGYLNKQGYKDDSQYATLLGHRMRYRFALNARAAFHFIELRSSPQGHPGYRKIAANMHEHISKVHPTVGKSMKFVNKGEDPALTRLAAEIATQYKLEKLDKLSGHGSN